MPSAVQEMETRSISPITPTKKEVFTDVEMHSMTLQPKELIEKKITDLNLQIQMRCKYLAAVLEKYKSNPYLIKALNFNSIEQYLSFYTSDINRSHRQLTYYQDKLRHYFE